MANFLYELGSTVRDRLTTLEGTISARHEFLFGCLMYSVQPRGMGKDGEPIRSFMYDEGRLQLLAAPAPEMAQASREATARNPGGPGRDIGEVVR